MKSDKSKSTTENQSVNSERNRPQSPGSLSIEVAGSWGSEFVNNRPSAIAQRKLQGYGGAEFLADTTCGSASSHGQRQPTSAGAG